LYGFCCCAYQNKQKIKSSFFFICLLYPSTGHRSNATLVALAFTISYTECQKSSLFETFWGSLEFLVHLKIKENFEILSCSLRFRTWIFPSSPGFWDNPQWIFQEHWTYPYWVLVGMRPQKVFHENQSIRGFFSFESSFQNCFWKLFRSSGLSEIC
jgi:hypothetical protein